MSKKAYGILGVLLVAAAAGGGYYFWQQGQEAATPAVAQAPQPIGQPMVVIDFEPGLVELSTAARNNLRNTIPVNARDLLQQVQAAAEAEPKKIVLLTGFFSESLNPNNTQELAQYRMQMIFNELSGRGVREARMVIAPPIAVNEPARAHRVEVRVQ